MRACTWLVLALSLYGCDDAAPSVDASAIDTAVPSIDAASDAAPDADLRAAAIGDCTTITGPHGLTAEVTDWGGYIPSITVTIPVGSVARFGYADGGTEHTIVSGEPGMSDGLFASAPFDGHGTLTCLRFDAPGTYPIHCDRHPTGLESGTVTVVP